jgi:O-antigen/teichoic acid export membrane protein
LLDFPRFQKSFVANRGTLNKGIVSIVDQAIVSAGSFLTGIIVARMCDKADFGLFVLGLTIVTFALSLQSSLITSPYMIRIAKLKEFERRSFTGSTFAHQLMLSLACGLLLMSVSFFFRGQGSGMTTVMSALAVALPFILTKEYIRSVSLARLHIHSVLLSDSLLLCVQIIGMLLLARHHKLSAPVTFLIIAASCGVVGISLAAWRHSWFEFNLREIRVHLSGNLGLGRWLLASSFINTFSKELYPWMLTFFHSPAATGSFAACVGVVFMSNPFVIGLNNFLGPLANRVHADKGKRELFALIRSFTLLVVAVMGLFCGTLFMFGDEIVTFIYGLKYSGNGLLISILGLGMLSSVSTSPIGFGLYALERTDVTFKACLCSLIVTLSIGMLLVKYMGPLGAGLSLLIGNVFESLFKYHRFVRISNFRIVTQASG